MKLVVLGLGNPGAVYRNNRHNAGFRVLDRFARKAGASFRKHKSHYLEASVSDGSANRYILIKPLTYMNESGRVLASVQNRYREAEENLLVVTDNVDLPPGSLRLKRGGGNAGHNGLKSLIAFRGNGEFFRLYIGVGKPGAAGHSGEMIPHVLGNPSGEEKKQTEQAEERACELLESLGHSSYEEVMNVFNRSS